MLLEESPWRKAPGGALAAQTERGGCQAQAISNHQNYNYKAEGLTYGTHRFRLRQVDVGGTAHHSKVVKATLSPSEALSVKAYPNPVGARGTVRIATRARQEVTLVAYDVLGRRVARLFEGEVRPGRPASVTVEGAALPSGTYSLEARGKNAAETTRLTIVR